MAITQVIRGHTIVPELNAGSIVLDCGANRGEFARLIVERFGARVFSLEPNPTLYATLPRSDKIVNLPYALADRDGIMRLQIGGNDESSSLVASPAEAVQSVQVETRRLQTLLDELKLEHVDLGKFDIEGAEVGVIMTSSEQTLKRFSQMTIEFHDLCGYVSEAQVRQCIVRLQGLGFVACRMTYHGHGDMLLVNPWRLRFTPVHAVWAVHVERHVRAARRVWNRRRLGIARRSD